MSASLPSRDTRFPRWVKSVIRWGVVWFLLTLASVSIHAFTWMAAAPSSAEEPEHAAWKVVGNVLAMPTAPGWFAMVRIMGGLNGSSLRFAVGASLIGWVPWLVTAWIIVRLRARMIGVNVGRSRVPRHQVAPLRVARLSEAGGANLQAHPPTIAEGPQDEQEASNATSAPPPTTPPEPAHTWSRRRLLVDGVGSAAVVVGAGGYAHATVQEPWSMRVREFTVPIKDLPPDLDGLVLSVVADLHYGPRVPASHVERAIAAAVSINADLDLFLGDYIHNGPTFMPRVLQLMQPLIARGRSIGVMGNHDSYFGGFETNARLLADAGIRMLENQAVVVRLAATSLGAEAGSNVPRRPLTIDRLTSADAATTRGGLVFAGVADLWTQTPDVRGALEGVPSDVPRVILSHHPDVAECAPLTRRDVAQVRADLMLSGHTHGGQVTLPVIGAPIVPSDFGQRYRSGLCSGPACPVIVSNGIGVSLLPVRINVPPEVLKITLKRATA